jgi:hypothetical protein
MWNHLPLAPTLILLLLSLRLPLPALEKSAVLNAESIVTGTMSSFWIFPWLDGWHFHSHLEVDGLIFGRPIPKTNIRYHWVCQSCNIWIIIRPFPEIYCRSLWFIRQSKNGVWTADHIQPDHPGWADLDFLPELRERIATYKARQRNR